MKKRIMGLLMAFTLANSMLLTGCGTSGSSSEDSTASGDTSSEAATEAESSGDDQLSQIQAKGKIVFAMEGQWSPWTYHDESGDLVGYDTEVGKAIAEKLGVEAEFVEGEWDGLFTGLDTGRYDAIINGVEITEERAAKYNFTDPYAYVRTALCVAEDNTDITSFEDLDGKKTSNSLGSTYADMAAEYGATVENVDTLAETISMVTSGRVDATLNSEDSFADYLNEHPDAPIKLVATTEEASHVAIPLRADSSTDSLREAINTALSELAADGTLSQLSEKYFGSDISQE